MSEESSLFGEIIGWVGTGIALYFYIAPAVPFIKLVKESLKVNEVPGILLICSFMNCILWADYGLKTDKFLVYLANGIGGTITLIWITIYLIYLGKKNLKIALVLIILLMALVGGISYLFYKIINEEITGKVAMVFNILMYAAPGEKIFQVFKTKQYKLIPIFSTIGGLSCSLCWLIYALYLLDINMIIPNALGLFFAILQIIVYLIFYCKIKKDENFDIEDDDKLA